MDPLLEAVLRKDKKKAGAEEARRKSGEKVAEFLAQRSAERRAKLAETTGALLKATGADAVVFEFGNPRPVVELKYKEAVKIHGATKRTAEDALPGALVAATDTDGAVVVTSDGTDHHVYTQLGSTGTNVDEPSLLEIGW